jgi:hypothetical protein
MRLRLDGSETDFDRAYQRAPFAPLIHLVVLAAEAVGRLRRSRETSDQSFGGASDLFHPPKPLAPAG